MRENDPDPFWKNSDVINYLLTATPLALFLPLCYKKVCEKLSSEKNETESRQVQAVGPSGVDFVVVAETVGLPAFVSQNTRVIFDSQLGPLILAGITYHVVNIDDTRTKFQVALYPDGDPIESESMQPSATAVTATFQVTPEHLRHAAVLRCTPVAHPDLDVPSLLDSYFDYHMPLSNLMCLLEKVSTERPLIQSDQKTLLFGTKRKKGKYQVEYENSKLRRRFNWEREVFNNQLSTMFFKIGELRRTSQLPSDRDPRSLPFCYLSPEFSIDRFASRQPAAIRTKTPRAGVAPDDNADTPPPARPAPQVWVGLSQVQKVASQTASGFLEFRKPVAFKAKPVDADRMQAFEQLMRAVMPGSYIASATKNPDILVYDNDRTYLTSSSPRVLSFPADEGHRQQESGGSPIGRWVSEAGICTLHDLFKEPIDDSERKSLSFRDLLKEVLRTILFCCGAIVSVCCFADSAEYGVWRLSAPRMRSYPQQHLDKIFQSETLGSVFFLPCFSSSFSAHIC